MPRPRKPRAEWTWEAPYWVYRGEWYGYGARRTFVLERHPGAHPSGDWSVRVYQSYLVHYTSAMLSGIGRCVRPAFDCGDDEPLAILVQADLLGELRKLPQRVTFREAKSAVVAVARSYGFYKTGVKVVRPTYEALARRRRKQWNSSLGRK